MDSMSKPEIVLSKCCHPLPGDKIVGFSRSIGKVNIHRSDCTSAKKRDVDRKKVSVRWIDNIGRLVEIKVDAENRTGLFAEILNTLIAQSTTIKHAQAKATGDKFVECSFEMETAGLAHLQDLIKRLGRIQGVRHVFIGNVSS